MLQTVAEEFESEMITAIPFQLGILGKLEERVKHLVSECKRNDLLVVQVVLKLNHKAQECALELLE